MFCDQFIYRYIFTCYYYTVPLHILVLVVFERIKLQNLYLLINYSFCRSQDGEYSQGAEHLLCQVQQTSEVQGNRGLPPPHPFIIICMTRLVQIFPLAGDPVQEVSWEQTGPGQAKVRFWLKLFVWSRHFMRSIGFIRHSLPLGTVIYVIIFLQILWSPPVLRPGYLFRIPDPNCFLSGSQVSIKEFMCFNPKNCF